MSTIHHPQPIPPVASPQRGLAGQVRGQPRKLHWGWRYIPGVPLRQVTRLLRFLYTLQLEVRSFYHSMKESLSKKHSGVILGAHFELSSSGHRMLNKRTDARSCGIQELTSRYPWANNSQILAYLEGFDKGEQFALNTLGRPEPADVGQAYSPPVSTV